MSCKALVTRVRRITNVGKLHSFIKVSPCAGCGSSKGICMYEFAPVCMGPGAVCRLTHASGTDLQ